MNIRNTLVTLSLLVISSLGQAQQKTGLLPEGDKEPTIVVPNNNIYINFIGGQTILPILSNTEYKVSPIWKDAESPWFSISQKGTNDYRVNSCFWYKTTPRKGEMLFTYGNGKTKRISVIQSGNNAIDFLTGDRKIRVSNGTASSENNEKQDIEKSFDGDQNTFYQSQWQGGSTKFPVILTYNFINAPNIDYLIYTPRINQSNGRFGIISIEYNTEGNDTYIPIISDYNCHFTESPIHFELGRNGAKQVKSIRFTIKTGQNDLVSCAEMEFFCHEGGDDTAIERVFTDRLCHALRTGVTEKDLDQISNPFVRQLGYYLLKEDYDTLYRVGTYEPYENLQTISRRQKTSSYNRYENPTGIFFQEGEKKVIFADGIDKDIPVQLIIKDFGIDGNQPESTYSLRNGMNIITAENKGNGYVSYYTDEYKTAPNIRLHIAWGKVNGYFDLERGDTNKEWETLVKNACSDIIDIRTPRIQTAFPTDKFRELCPRNGVELALNMDSTIFYEREIMGLKRYGLEPKNRQFARVIPSGTMHADGTGAAAPYRAVDKWMHPQRSEFEFWGFAHELGHVNQVRPGLKWVGCGETTNNIYSAWVQFKLGTGFCKLEGEKIGIDDYQKMRGGRFNAYLEEGVRKGFPWQKQKGPDYSRVGENIVTVPNEDYDGNKTGRDTTLNSVNYDHFVKLVPLWQLQLYCEQVGYSPNMYAKVCQAIRTTDETKMSDGQLQIKFMREVCDSTQLNFLPFFEKAGMLKPIRYYVQDYGADWLNISEEMINELKAHVKAKGYPKAEGEVNYISALNWKIYKEKKALKGSTIGTGCTPTSHVYDKKQPAVPYVRIDHHIWQNAVAFETYNKKGELIRISMHGLGADTTDSFTMVMFPQDAAYIKAVGWNGKRMICYQK